MGITVVRAGKEVTDRRGKLLGAITNVAVPSSREACSQANAFLPKAVQVRY